MYQMPYALFRNGKQISMAYRTRQEVEMVAFERNLVDLKAQDVANYLMLIPGYAICPCEARMETPSNDRQSSVTLLG